MFLGMATVVYDCRVLLVGCSVFTSLRPLESHSLLSFERVESQTEAPCSKSIHGRLVIPCRSPSSQY
jgi:hypothetical protein